MPVLAATCVVECGDPPNSSSECLVDENDILVDEFTLTPTREITEFTDAQGCVIGVKLFNPVLEFTLDGAPLNNTGDLTGNQPGCEILGLSGISVANLANHSATPFGHDLSLGCTLLTDVTYTCSKDAEAANINVTGRHYQHAVTP